MRPWLYFPIFWFPIFWAVICLLLYRRGIMVTKSIAAVFFSFRADKRGDLALLNSCTGWVRHVGRFRRSGIYTFTLDCQLSEGDAAVSLLNQEKRELLRLNRSMTAGSVDLHREARYYLHWEFRNVTGNCVLHWENDSTE